MFLKFLRKQKKQSWLNKKAIDLIAKLMPKVCFKICIAEEKKLKIGVVLLWELTRE